MSRRKKFDGALPKIDRMNKLAEIRHRREISRIDAEWKHFEKQHRAEGNRAAHCGRRVPYHDGGLIRSLFSECDLSTVETTLSAVKDSETEDLKIDDGVIREFQDLFMTGGEVDLEKVLCLHVFSTRQSFSCPKLPEGDKEQSLTRYSHFLPSYLIDEDSHAINCSCWKRPSALLSCDAHPIKVHLSINVKIENLLNVVLSTLERLNESKLKALIERVQTVEKIIETLNRSTSLEFLKFLLKSDLMTSELNYKTKACTLVKGTTRRIHDVAKFQKNLVFRIPAPKMLRSVFIDIVEYFGEDSIESMAVNESVQSFGDFTGLRKLFEREKHVRRAFGYKVLQYRASRSGILIVNRVGGCVAYLRGPGDVEHCTSRDSFVNHLNILMEDPDQIVMTHATDKAAIIEENVSCLKKEVTNMIKIAQKRVPDLKKRSPQASSETAKMTSIFFQRLPEVERLRLAEDAARKQTSLTDLVKTHVSKSSILSVVEASTLDERVGYLFKRPDEGGLGLARALLSDSDVDRMMTLARMPVSGRDFALVDRLPVERTEGDLCEAKHENGFRMLKIKQKLYQSELNQKFEQFIRKDFSKS